MMRMCTKGKSCGATCISRSKRCELELGPLVSESLTKVRSKLGVVKLYEKVRQNRVKGFQGKFNEIRGQLKQELGGQVRKTADVLELKKRLHEAGLLPKSKKSENLGDIFKGLVEQGKKEKAPSMPSNLKKQLWALPGAEKKSESPDKLYGGWETSVLKAHRDFLVSRDVKGDKKQVERIDKELARRDANVNAAKPIGKEEKASIPGDRKTDRSAVAEASLPSEKPKKGESDLFLDDLSRILRGEAPQNIEIASAAGPEGFKARVKQSGTPTSPGATTGNTRWAREDAQDFDGALGKVRREGDKSYKGWEDSYGSGARKIGEGAFGTVIRNPDGTFIKRGDISDTEATLIKRLGDMDLGPRLVAADVNGPAKYHKENFVDVKNGRIAMGEVPGKPIGEAKASDKVNGKPMADIYWKALADLHRQGIAHNDAHIDNILVDDKGKGRWVDLGLAQASPKAALAEAMGIFPHLKGGDDVSVRGGAKGNGNWQTPQWNGTGVKELQRARDKGGQTWTEMMERFPVASRVWENKPAVIYEMKRMGMDVNEINSIIEHGIRSPLSSYDKSDGFSRISDAQAQNLLNMLYDGI